MSGETSSQAQHVAAAATSGSLKGCIDEIYRHYSDRRHARHWAKHLRFLTFDDGLSDSARSKQTEVRRQCLSCAQRLPLPTGHICAAHTSGYPGSSRDPTNMDEDPCVHVQQLSCDKCQHIPMFPTDQPVTRFRVRHLDAVEMDCEHFLAVSYRWPDHGAKQEEGTRYKVVDEDGTTRDMRAPKATIDRVVDYAVRNGFRMIWIDQECIKQDDEHDKALAVQCMDIVYTNAHTSVGLCSSAFERRHLEALCLQYHRRVAHSRIHTRGRVKMAFRPFLTDLAQALVMLSEDQWSTRAWILQEAFATDGRMVLLFPRAPGIDVSGWLLPCHELSLIEIVIELDKLERIVCTGLEDMAAMIADLEDRAIPSPFAPNDATGIKLNKSSLERLSTFYAKAARGSGGFYVSGSAKLGRRLDCSAAVSVLTHRHCHDTWDMIPIVANLCNWSSRLNMITIKQSSVSRDHCIVALAIFNGDLSILVPELYGQPKMPETESHSSKFSWESGEASRLNSVLCTEAQTTGSFGLMRYPLVHKQPSLGLEVPATLWNSHEFVELEHIQLKYVESWINVRREYAESGYVSNKSNALPGFLRALPGYDHVIQLWSMQEYEDLRAANTSKLLKAILLDIILYLRDIGRCAEGDAIYNSISKHDWLPNRNENCNDVESVADLASEISEEEMENIFDITIDPDRKGVFHQAWIVERIMQDGGLWTFCLAKEWSIEAVTQPLDLPLEDEPQVLESRDSSEPASTERSVALHELPHAADAEALSGESPVPLVEKTHAFVLASIHAFHMMCEVVMDRTTFDGHNHEFGGLHGTPNDNSLMAILAHTLALHERLAKDMAYRKSFISRRAFFDVDCTPDETLTIMSPVQLALESMPRPTMRSMSVSWIVEPRRTSIADDSGEQLNQFVSKGMVRGMWTWCLLPSARPSLLV